jgi:hypothetical protein
MRPTFIGKTSELSENLESRRKKLERHTIKFYMLPFISLSLPPFLPLSLTHSFARSLLSFLALFSRWVFLYRYFFPEINVPWTPSFCRNFRISWRMCGCVFSYKCETGRSEKRQQIKIKSNYDFFVVNQSFFKTSLYHSILLSPSFAIDFIFKFQNLVFLT